MFEFLFAVWRVVVFYDPSFGSSCVVHLYKVGCARMHNPEDGLWPIEELLAHLAKLAAEG